MPETKPQNLEKLFETVIEKSGKDGEFKIVKSSTKFIPGEIADEFVEVNSKRKGFPEMTNRLIEYCNSFYILDIFGNDHGARRNWRM